MLKQIIFMMILLVIIGDADAQSPISNPEPINGTLALLGLESKDTALVTFFGLTAIIDNIESEPNNFFQQYSFICTPVDFTASFKIETDYASFSTIRLRNSKSNYFKEQSFDATVPFDVSDLPSGFLYDTEVIGSTYTLRFTIAKP
jgi:hypothetical protein